SRPMAIVSITASSGIKLDRNDLSFRIALRVSPLPASAASQDAVVASRQKAALPPLLPKAFRARRATLAAGLALLHEARLGGARELLAVGADSFGLAGIVHALLHERGLCGARERLAILAHGLALAGILRESRSGRKGRDNGGQE